MRGIQHGLPAVTAPVAAGSELMFAAILLESPDVIGANQAIAEKEYLKAIDYYGWAEKKSGDWRASLGLANAYRARLDYAQARSYYAKVVSLPNAPINSYFYFGQCLMVNREYTEAEKWFAKYAAAAEVLKTAFTDKATVARIGGDEFVAILKNQESPQEFIDRMPALIALNNRYYQGPELRFSMGSATRKTNEALEKTLIRADEAMYRNKESRYRNRI